MADSAAPAAAPAAAADAMPMTEERLNEEIKKYYKMLRTLRKNNEDAATNAKFLTTHYRKLKEEGKTQLPTELNWANKQQTILKDYKLLKGHFGKVYAMHWAGIPVGGATKINDTDPKLSSYLISASQDGKLLIWDAYITNKLIAIPLKSSWVMTCAYSPSGNMVASGGLDNICTIYSISPTGKDSKDKTHKIAAELSGHTGYLSCCRFWNDQKIVTSSGDTSCAVWDIESGRKEIDFHNEKKQKEPCHNEDVMSVSLSPTSPNIFVSGSCDHSAKVWDTRSGICVMSFDKSIALHQSDINSVQFLPTGNGFVTGSDDTSCKLVDMRAEKVLQSFSMDTLLVGVMAVSVSLSGRLLFAGYENERCLVWDTLNADVPLSMLAKHTARVSCLGVAADGKALCTGSWDQFLKVWGR